jgi:SAM-dependent methyltransferase
VPDDRWWRGYDTAIVAELPAGARVLDVGSGDGGLVERLGAQGLDALGVDPRAPEAAPRLISGRVETLTEVGLFDGVCAVMSLHHAELEAATAAIARLLRPGGRLFVYDFAWEVYDERAAAWLSAHDPSERDNSVGAWRLEHHDLNTGDAIGRALRDNFELRDEEHTGYLARMLGMDELESEEAAMIAAGAVPALGRWYVAVGG